MEYTVMMPEFDEYGETEQSDDGYCCSDINCKDTCCNDDPRGAS